MWEGHKQLPMPWSDPSGRFSPLKASVLTALFLPFAWSAWLLWHDGLGLAPPAKETVHEAASWAIRFLLLTLAITPLRLSLDWPRLALVRRMVGVAAFLYIALHVALFVADQGWDLSRATTEVVYRLYLKIGFYALIILIYLVTTSTDRIARSLGPLWHYMHRGLYVAVAFAIVHEFMGSDAEAGEPWVIAGLYMWLMGYRLAIWSFGLRRGLPVWATGVLSLAAAGLTALGESVYDGIELGASPARILSAYLQPTMLRPGWIVLVIGLGVTVAAICARQLARRRVLALTAPQGLP